MLPAINTRETQIDHNLPFKIDGSFKNCVETAKKIVNLAGKSPSIPSDDNTTAQTEKGQEEKQAERNLTQDETEKLAKEFFNNYFAKKPEKDLMPYTMAEDGSHGYVTIGDILKEHSDKTITSAALVILHHNLENSTDQALLADYALLLYRSKNWKEFNRILLKLEALGNITDILILRMLAAHTIDPKDEEKYKSLRTLKNDTAKNLSIDPIKTMNRLNLDPLELLKDGNLKKFLEQVETQWLQAERQITEFLNIYRVKRESPLLKRGFDELFIVLSKYNLLPQAKELLEQIYFLDLDKETRESVNRLMPTILLYIHLTENHEGPLVSLNKNMEVIFNVDPDKDNKTLELADNLITNSQTKESTYFGLLKTVLGLLRGTNQVKTSIYNIDPYKKDSTSLLLSFYIQILTGTLKQVPPKPILENYTLFINATERNSLEYCFKHHYLYARALAILSLKGNEKPLLTEALDHLNTIISEKNNLEEYVDEAYYKIRGRIHFQLRDYPNALVDFLTVYRIKPTDPKRVLDVVTVLTKQGNHKGSFSLIQTLFENLPEDQTGSKSLASLIRIGFTNILSFTGKVDNDSLWEFHSLLNELKRVLQKCCKGDSTFCQQYYSLAQIALAQKYPLEAEVILREILLIDPNFKPALDDIKKLETQLKPAPIEPTNLEEERPNVEPPQRQKKNKPTTEKQSSLTPPFTLNPDEIRRKALEEQAKIEQEREKARNAEIRRKALEEQARIEEEREKARYAQLQREHQKKLKEEKRIATGRARHLSVQTQPTNFATPVASQLIPPLVPPKPAPQPVQPPTAPGDLLPELPVNRKYSVDYLINEYIPKMTRCTYAEITDEEKARAIPKPPTLPQPPKLSDDRRSEELTPYRKDKLEEPPIAVKRKKKKNEPEIVVRDNPDINRVESSRRHIRDLEDLFKIQERAYPQSVPLNAYAVDRALRYYLMRFGECIHSTSEKSKLSVEVAKEISSQIMDIEIAHHLRDDLRNWFQFISPTKLNLMCQTLVKYQLHDSLKAWVENKDKADIPFKSNPKLIYSLSGLVPFEDKEKWKQLPKAEQRERYIGLLMHELDLLSLIAKSEKMSKAQFHTEGKTYQSAAKMSISIIAKCLTNIGMDLKAFKGLIHLSNLIGHEIGEDEQIRYYEFEEIKDASILYNLSLNADKLKGTILEKLNSKGQAKAQIP